jgi:hypothetical protein
MFNLIKCKDKKEKAAVKRFIQNYRSSKPKTKPEIKNMLKKKLAECRIRPEEYVKELQKLDK